MWVCFEVGPVKVETRWTLCYSLRWLKVIYNKKNMFHKQHPHCIYCSVSWLGEVVFAYTITVQWWYDHWKWWYGPGPGRHIRYSKAVRSEKSKCVYQWFSVLLDTRRKLYTKKTGDFTVRAIRCNSNRRTQTHTRTHSIHLDFYLTKYTAESHTISYISFVCISLIICLLWMG